MADNHHYLSIDLEKPQKPKSTKREKQFHGDCLGGNFLLSDQEQSSIRSWLKKDLIDDTINKRNNKKTNNPHLKLKSPGNYSLRIVIEIHRNKIITAAINPSKNSIDLSCIKSATIAKKFLTTSKTAKNFVTIGDKVIIYHHQKDLRSIDNKDHQHKLSTNEDNYQIIHRLPRTNSLTRRDPFYPKRTHIIGSNIDQVILVSSLIKPKTDFDLINRYLAFCALEKLKVVLVFSKIDLFNQELNKLYKNLSNSYNSLSSLCSSSSQDNNNIYLTLNKIIYLSKLNYQIYFTQLNKPLEHELSFYSLYRSCNNSFFNNNDNLSVSFKHKNKLTNQLPSLLKDHIINKLSILTGLSGVGKSSLLNICQPKTPAKISSVKNHGRHTTSSSKLVAVNINGGIIDTPGIKSFALSDYDLHSLSAGFVEFIPFLNKCHYSSCTHTKEPMCKIKQAVDQGIIPKWRWNTYQYIVDNQIKQDKNQLFNKPL